MDLAVDEFTVRFDPARVPMEAMLRAIEALGYRPSIAGSRVDPTPPAPVGGGMPEVVRAALARARAQGKLLFLDFFAEWCGACRTMDRTTFADPEVARQLQAGFVFLKVDTDAHPEIGGHFRVLGLPTLVVLDGTGRTLYRHMGPLPAESLLEALAGLKDNPTR